MLQLLSLVLLLLLKILFYCRCGDSCSFGCCSATTAPVVAVAATSTAVSALSTLVAVAVVATASTSAFFKMLML